MIFNGDFKKSFFKKLLFYLFNLKVYFDKSVVENEVVAFNAGSHTRSIKMKAKDLVRVVNPVIGEFSSNDKINWKERLTKEKKN